MKSSISIIGILLIVVGIGALAFEGFTYTKHEEVAQIGNIQITADTQKTVYFKPIFGGIALAVGIAMVLIGRRS